MYQTVNQFKKGYQHTFSISRNKKDELAMNKKEKAEIWKEYFDKLRTHKNQGNSLKKEIKKLAKLKLK